MLVDNFHIRHSSELYELLNTIDVVQRTNIQWLHWLGHIIEMEEDAPARRVFDEGISEEDYLISVGRTK